MEARRRATMASLEMMGNFLNIAEASTKLRAWDLDLLEARTTIPTASMGSGTNLYPGPTSAVMAFKSNVEVTVVDINSDRIAAWKSMNLPIYEPGLEPLVFSARDGVDMSINSSISHLGSNSGQVTRRPSLFFSTDVNKAIEEADLIFVCVNTPTKAHGIGKGAGADLSFVEAATRNIARVAKRSKIVVEKSTVPCRTAESIRQIVSCTRCTYRSNRR